MRGLVTYYTVFVIELHSRRVHVLGSTTQPDEAFVIQTMRHLTADVDGVLRESPADLRSRSEVERRGRALPGNRRRPVDSNTVHGAQLQCACGAVRTLN